VDAAIVLNGSSREVEPGIADFLLFPRRVELPASGLMGVFLDTQSEGEGVAVKGFSAESGAQAAGMEENDRIVRIGDEAIHSYADIRIALMGSRPGQTMPVTVQRSRIIGEPERLDLEVRLQ
jgi:S1-C subfamily serine protease